MFLLSLATLSDKRLFGEDFEGLRNCYVGLCKVYKALGLNDKYEVYDFFIRDWENNEFYAAYFMVCYHLAITILIVLQFSISIFVIKIYLFSFL